MAKRSTKATKIPALAGSKDEPAARDNNMTLSQARAQSVREYLIGKGVRADRLSAKGYGPDRPLMKGDSDEARDETGASSSSSSSRQHTRCCT